MTLAQVFDWVVGLINFAVMFYLFRLIVIIPMREAVKLREQRVALRLKEIGETAKEAEQTKADFEERFGNVNVVLADIKQSSERSLAQVKARLNEKAASEERYILEKAEAEAESIKREAEQKVRSLVAGQAVERAEAMLEKALDKGSHEKILAAAVSEIGGLRAP